MNWRRPTVGLLVIDSEQLSFRRGLIGLVALLAVLVFVVAFGYAGTAAALGALVTAVSAGSGSTRVRIERTGVVAVAGSMLMVVGVWSGERGWTAALAVGVVALVATLASVYGKEAATAGFMLTLLLLLSLALAGSSHSSAALGGSFLVGGALVVLLQPLLAWKEAPAPEGPADAAVAVTETQGRSDWLSPLRRELSLDSQLLQFAIVRAGGLAGAAVLGWHLFDEHPYWAAFVVFAITMSGPSELAAVGVHRAVGTIIGAAVAVELVRSVDSRPWLVAALIAASALAISFSRANYAFFTFFVTAVLVLATHLVRGDAALAAYERISATLLGVLLAFAITSLVLLVARRRAAASPA